MSLTNVSFPIKDEPMLKKAIAHYRYENLNQFFRICAYALIDHYSRADTLLSPLHFEAFKPVVRKPANPIL